MQAPKSPCPCPLWLWHHNHLWWHIQELRSREQKLLCIRGEEKLDKCCLSCMSESLLNDKHLCQEGPYGDWTRDKSLREKSQSLYLLMGIHESNKTNKQKKSLRMNSSAKAGFLAPSFSSSCLLWAIPSAGLSCPLAVSLFIEHYLLSTSWIRQHARDWGCKHEKTWWSLPSVRSQHSGRDRHAHKELQNNTFKAPISMWNYVYFYVFIYSLSVLHHNSAVDFITFTARFVAPQHLDSREC